MHTAIILYYRYTDGAKQRVIRMVEAQVDPMEPPKHLIKKVPRGPGSPPVPILHSPPRKLTVEDKQAWKVPPCISNWKNARGYTIPLDKRLAADGRGLQEVTINNKFATLSESLYVAERKASEDLRIRNQIRKKMAMREKEDREKDLRDMASRARMERAGVVGDDEVDNENDNGVSDAKDRQAALASRGSGSERQRGEAEEDSRRTSNHDYENSRGSHYEESRNRANSGSHDDKDREDHYSGSRDDRNYRNDRNDREQEESAPQGETSDERVARQQRERLRQDRRKEREREIRLDNMKVKRYLHRPKVHPISL